MNPETVFPSTLRHPRRGAQGREAVRRRHAGRLLAHAREHSPYFARTLAGLGPEVRWQDVPPTNKVEMMAHFDEWVADPEVTYAGVQELRARTLASARRRRTLRTISVLHPLKQIVDELNAGTVAEKILVTNLANLVQPFIRFEITDRVIRHADPCPCGTRSPWLELEGRSDDIVTFAGDDGPVRIAPLTLYAVMTRVTSIRRFQVVSHPGNRLELRLDCPDSDRESAFDAATTQLRALLSDNGVSAVEIALSPDEPRPHPISGKYAHIARAR